MQITIHQSGDLLDSTKEVINEKISKLETFYDRIERADVHIKSDDGKGAAGHTVSVRLAVPGPDLSAEHTDQSIKRAIADVAEALRRQLKKLKEKQTDHHVSIDGPRPTVEDLDAQDQEAARKILRSEEQL